METQQLLNHCLKGKKEAQRQLYNKYAAVMLGVCYRYTKSLEDAEDVLQEGFIKVFTHLHQFKQEGDLGAWIRKIMVNTAITYLNKHQRYKKEMDLNEHLHSVSDEYSETSLEAKEFIELIRQLPSGYQTVFNMIAVEGFEHEEVSELLNRNINTVRSQYSRARSLLINMIKKNEQNEIKSYAKKV